MTKIPDKYAITFTKRSLELVSHQKVESGLVTTPKKHKREETANKTFPIENSWKANVTRLNRSGKKNAKAHSRRCIQTLSRKAKKKMKIEEA
jgi:hypothetical protein